MHTAKQNQMLYGNQYTHTKNSPPTPLLFLERNVSKRHLRTNT